MYYSYNYIKTNHQDNYLHQRVVSSQPKPHSFGFGQYSSLHVQVFLVTSGKQEGNLNLDTYKEVLLFPPLPPHPGTVQENRKATMSKSKSLTFQPAVNLPSHQVTLVCPYQERDLSNNLDRYF